MAAIGVFLSVPLWSSGFRPFFLLGALYGPVLIVAWYGARLGVWPLTGVAASLPLVHGHELVFGFAVAIVCGIVLTALPSWSGTRELRGTALIALAALWIAGRVGFHALAPVAPTLAMLLDGALLPALILMIVPGLVRARPRLFLWTLPPLAALAAGNIAFHLAAARGSSEGMRQAVLLGLYGLVFLYSLYGGLLTPAFTRNFLKSRGEPAAGILVPLEYATALAMLALAAVDLLGAPAYCIVATAAVAVALHLWRFVRWRGWRTKGAPLLWTLHAGYAWLIIALTLRGTAELTPVVPRDAWIHAFTVGALGLTMGSLMTRVTLRHTGRAPVVAPLMLAAFRMLLVAPLARLAYATTDAGVWTLVAASALWGGAFVIFLVRYGSALLAPSLEGSAAALWGPRPSFTSG